MDQATEPPTCPQHHGFARQHHLPGYLTARRAPLTWLVRHDGDVCCSVDGLYSADRRLLSLWRISMDGTTLSPVVAQLFSADGMRVVSYVSPADGRSPAPQVTLTRIRVVRTCGAGEQIEVVNRGNAPFTTTLYLSAASDLATPANIQAGAPGPPRPWNVENRTAIASDDDGTAVTLRPPSDAQIARPRPGLLQFCWEVQIPPGKSWRTLIVIKAIIPTPYHGDPIGSDRRALPT